MNNNLFSFAFLDTWKETTVCTFEVSVRPAHSLP